MRRRAFINLANAVLRGGADWRRSVPASVECTVSSHRTGDEAHRMPQQEADMRDLLPKSADEQIATQSRPFWELVVFDIPPC